MLPSEAGEDAKKLAGWKAESRFPKQKGSLISSTVSVLNVRDKLLYATAGDAHMFAACV